MSCLSIRWRLTLWYVTALSVILVAFGVTIFALMRSHLLARVDSELIEESRELNSEIEFARNEQDLKEQLIRHYAEHGSHSFQVDRQDGTVLFGSPWLLAHKLPVSDESNKFATSVQTIDVPHAGQHRLYIRRVRGPEGPLTVHAITSLARSDRELRWILTIFLVGGAIALVIAFSGGYLIAQHAMRPINNITATAERISSQNLSERIPLSNRHDELGRLATTLNGTFDRLQSTIDEMRQFTADAAHELRTPLAVIRTEAEVSLRGPSTLDQYRRVAEVAVDQTSRLSTLVDQLLTLSRQESGLQQSRHEEVAVRAIVLDVAESLRVTAEQQGIDVEIGSLPNAVVLGDDVALSQLFFNLLDNAIKFTPPPGKVTISGTIEDNFLRVTVEDTGIGIEAADQPKIFQRFYRGNSARTDGGTGLGLAICKSIIDSHKGKIEVESQRGIGSRFFVYLPLQSVESSNPALPVSMSSCATA